MEVTSWNQILFPGGEVSVGDASHAPLRGPGCREAGIPPNQGPEDSPNLDNNIYISQQSHNEPEFVSQYEIKLKRRKGRYYHALCSGMVWHRKESLRFLTLTSPPGARDVAVSWNTFKTELTRLTPEYLVKNGYLTKKQLNTFYNGRNLDQKLNFAYLAMKTAEGNGVLHIITAGDFVPVSWIRETWTRLHGSTSTWKGDVVINIQLINKNASDDALRAYMMKQYMAGQDAYIRHFMSKNWLWSGYRHDWLALVHQHGYHTALVTWQNMMYDHRRQDVQSSLVPGPGPLPRST